MQTSSPPEDPISNEIRTEILTRRATRERKLAVCSGTAGLPPAERAELLTVLAADTDPVVAERAAQALVTVPAEDFLTALGRTDVAPELFRYCTDQLGEQTAIADALARNPSAPAEMLCRIARALSTAAVEALLEDLDRLTQHPALIVALRQHPGLTASQRELLEELQREAMSETELAETVRATETEPATRQTLLQRLARMTVIERVQLALKGNREERLALIRDPCKVVQRAVLQSPKLSDAEVESYAAMANVSEDVLRQIARNRNFMKNYGVVRNLLNNAKTPLDISLHLLPRLNPLDLRSLTTNKNIPETLRSMAMKLHRQRSEARLRS